MKREWTREKTMQAAAGLITGLCNGLFGAGGGAVAVLALEKLCKRESKEAHAGAISIMLPLTAVSGAVYAFNSSVEWDSLLWVMPGVVAGGILGARLTGKLSGKWLDRVFGTMMFISGLWLLL